MGAAEAHQAVSGVAKANQCAAYFQVEIGLWVTRNVGMAQVKNRAKEKNSQSNRCGDQKASPLPVPDLRDTCEQSPGPRLANLQKLADVPPTAHDFPQIPTISCNCRRASE